MEPPVARKDGLTPCFILAFSLMSLSMPALSAARDEWEDEDVVEFLEDLGQGITGMDSYSCIMTTENSRGDIREFKVSRVRFKKPNLLRVDVLEGDKRGSSVALNRDGVIRGKNAFGFRRTMKETDPRLRNIRGSTFLNASLLDKLGRIKDRIENKGFRAAVSETDLDGRSVYHMHIYHSDPADAMTDEDIWFDRESFFILKNRKFEGDTLVSDVTWRDIEVNIPVDDAEFEL